VNHLKDGISVFNGKYSLNEALDKAFDNTIRFFRNFKITVSTISTNSRIITDSKGLHITLDFFGLGKALFVIRFNELTIIDTFEKQAISKIKKNIADKACVFAVNTDSCAKFAEGDAKQAKKVFETAKSDLITAQERITKFNSVYKIAQKNATTAQEIDIMAFGIDAARKNVITAQERFDAAQKRFDATQVDVILTKNIASKAATDSEKKKKDYEAAQDNIKEIKNVNTLLIDIFIIS
jgi:hypothetical protein